MLAALLLNHGRVVPTQDLITELWCGDPPAGTENALHAHASRLRGILRAWDRITESRVALQTRRPGYALLVPGDHIDAVRFEALCKRADHVKTASPGQAVTLLRRARSLWRGSALQDVPHGPIRDQGVKRLESGRRLMMMNLIELNLGLGKHVEIIPELEALVLENPLEERLYSQLMEALQRAGRAGDALGVYQLARVSLAERTGLSPSPALERQMLRILDRRAR
ncbi:AfsR/SARP family transcriptional regulator [Nonomuraea sp. NPDC050404]|uniref:AfsR/SARP family transcriptional regulator n=1 Tax=Nonomuraea sp. NPDC050404 TaxID=3155783 RepID=UPI0033D302CF